uniref:Uncharacterized protein n=1 Tax=Tetraodon nigroviridis TaxID=99883 RepID=H3C631_TETNG
SSSSPPSAGTNSTNAVSGSGLCQSQGSSQCLAPNTSAPHQRKGTFTDDLHKLVDNWARDAMNLSQGKRSAKPLQQAPAPGHSLGRKYSAPSQLCASSIGGSAQLPTNTAAATSSAVRHGSLCHPPASSTPPQPLGPYPATLGGQGQIPGQVFPPTNTLQKSVSNPGGPNLRTT